MHASKILLNELVGGYKYLKSVETGRKFVNLKSFRKRLKNFRKFWENFRKLCKDIRKFLRKFTKFLENLKKLCNFKKV